MRISDQLKGCVGCGVACALIAGAFGASDAGQWVLFLFGATYGNLWMQHS